MEKNRLPLNIAAFPLLLLLALWIVWGRPVGAAAWSQPIPQAEWVILINLRRIYSEFEGNLNSLRQQDEPSPKIQANVFLLKDEQLKEEISEYQKSEKQELPLPAPDETEEVAACVESWLDERGHSLVRWATQVLIRRWALGAADMEPCWEGRATSSGHWSRGNVTVSCHTVTSFLPHCCFLPQHCFHIEMQLCTNHNELQ